MSYSPYFLNKNATGNVAGSRGTVTNFQNGSGSTLAKGKMVSVNASGQLLVTLPTSETLVQSIVGTTSMSIPDAATGSVVDNGRLEDITTSLAIGDPVYLNRDGTFTNIKPSEGDANAFEAGDFVIFVGVVVKNEFNGSLKDLKLMISVIGQL